MTPPRRTGPQRRPTGPQRRPTATQKRPTGPNKRPQTRAGKRPTGTLLRPAPVMPSVAPVNVEEDARLAWPTARAIMQRAAGVVLADDQHYLLEARIRPLVRAGNHGSLSAFVRAVSTAAPGSPTFLDFVDALTTHETFFFRDAAFWKALEETILPRVIAGLQGRPLRVWSAACSTGQEPYSIAMLLRERFPEAAKTARILGTDIAEPTLARARLGVYTTLEVNRGLSAARMVRHFEQVPGGLRLKEDVRGLVELRQGNLLAADPYPRADIVLCRNVLIYFSESDRAAVLKRLAASADSHLGIGCTERFGAHLPQSPGWFEVRALGPTTPERSA